MIVLRDTRADEVATLARIQERALAALGHIFPPERHPFPRDAVRLCWAEALEDSAARASSSPTSKASRSASPACGRIGCSPSISCPSTGEQVADALYRRALEIVRELGHTHCNLWVLAANTRARRFYERRGWRENGRTQVVPLPPNPLEVGYTLDF